MHNLVVVQDAADYDTWVGQLRANARTAALNPRRADRGKQLIVSGKFPCGSCHLITDAGTSGNVGPHLDGVATRADTNQDGRLTNRGINPGAPDRVAQYLRAAIVNPSGFVVPGYANLMPKNFGDPTVMPDDDREAIVNYLLTLK
jgi:cytochrome c2